MPQIHTKWWQLAISLLGIALLVLVISSSVKPAQKLLSPLGQEKTPTSKHNDYEVFGFAPYWNFDKLNDVDFDVLTTMAYFDLPIDAKGNLIRSSQGYQTFKSSNARRFFDKAQNQGARVVLTITLMQNGPILRFLDNIESQKRAIDQTIEELQTEKLDGVNIDIEYSGSVDREYRNKFTLFVKDMTNIVHSANPKAKTTVSVYASAASDPKLYDIGALSSASDGIFMMAYDFATHSAQQAMPTAPLYGHKQGKYWYDVSTAVEDFLRVMPADKLILGVPWYGYDYPVYEPVENAQRHKGITYWYKQWVNKWRWVWRRGSKELPSFVQTYEKTQTNITSSAPGVTAYQEGWDDTAKVGWKAYKNGSDIWRMVFIEDPRSLEHKYDFIKDKKLAGVGMWALGFDNGQKDMWELLKKKFGT